MGIRNSTAPPVRDAASTTPVSDRAGTSPPATTSGGGRATLGLDQLGPAVGVGQHRLGAGPAGEGITGGEVARPAGGAVGIDGPGVHRLAQREHDGTGGGDRAEGVGGGPAGPVVVGEAGSGSGGPARSSAWAWVITARARTPSTRATIGPSRPAERRAGAPNPGADGSATDQTVPT